MIGKITVGAMFYAALQLSVFDSASSQADSVLSQADEVQKLERSIACGQAKAYGLQDLQRIGLRIECP